MRGGVVEARRAGAWSTDDTSIELEAVDGGYRVELLGTGPAEGLALTFPTVDADTMHQQGYQSWGFSGTVIVPVVVERDDDGKPAMEVAKTGDPIHEERGVSMHATILRRNPDGAAIVIGALRAEVATTGISAVRGDDGTELTILYGPQREQLPDQDGTVRSEVFYVGAAATPDQALAQLGEQLAAEHANSRAPLLPTGGWYSWNERFVDIDEQYITDHVDVVAAAMAPKGMTLVELDDGWERAWGDWQANAQFPSGMSAMATTITDSELVAGIWLAPFLVDMNSDAAASDAALFVQSPDGGPLVHRLSGNNRAFYVLDGTNPDSMAIVVDELETLAAAGYTFFKLDFLYAGALSGGRSMDVTGVQALRAGMDKIRAAVGQTSVINACGAPTLQMVGVADSLRIGPDTAFEGFDLSWGLVAGAARNVAARRYLFPTIYLDADQVQLRPPYTAVEARAGAVIAALAGPAYALGDDLTVLDSELLNVALDDTILDIAAAQQPAIAVGLMDMMPADEIAASPVIETLRFPSGMVVTPPEAFTITGGSGTNYTITVDWEGAHSVTVE